MSNVKAQIPNQIQQNIFEIFPSPQRGEGGMRGCFGIELFEIHLDFEIWI
jgi:hypothetical protein